MGMTVFAQSGKTSDSSTVAEITSLEQESVKADLAGDRSFSEKYLADSYTGGTSFGRWDTRQSIIKDLENPSQNKTNTEVVADLKVRAYGDTAIATYQDTYDATVHNQHRARTILTTDTWNRQDGRWELIASHSSELAK